MHLWQAFWSDESGFILSAEAALVGTVGIVGATVGLSAIARSINDELTETAFAIRSLDQSYSFEGMKSERAWTAGSSYRQPPVAKSHRELRRQIEKQQEELERQLQKREENQKRDGVRDRHPERDPGDRRKERKRNRDRDGDRADAAVDVDWTIDGAG